MIISEEQLISLILKYDSGESAASIAATAKLEYDFISEDELQELGDRVSPALAKATVDPFHYAMKLRTGEIIEFNHADIHGEWVTVYFQEGSVRPGEFRPHQPGFIFERGVDIRINEIVWVADAPRGS